MVLACTDYKTEKFLNRVSQLIMITDGVFMLRMSRQNQHSLSDY
jgi:hypothetical protein